MSLTKECCSLPPIKSEYSPKGNCVQIGNLEVYETQDKTPDKVLICVYDIFGVHPNLRQVSDIMAEAGYRVVIPDFFNGNTLDEKDFPPKDPKVIQDFLEKFNWPTKVKPDLEKLVEHYKGQGGNVKSFGIFGFCWGGRMALDAAIDLPETFKAAALIHPSLCKTEDADKVKVPMILLPSQTDPDMLPFYEILKKNLGEDKSTHHRFDDMHHGFAGGRGDFQDLVNRQRVNEAVHLMRLFFQQHV